ncbi:MAG: hypothetical protein E7536_09825 [Ruminococcaceae bacterium]|nr:hypothetical protein [Oscillospiraceae bacterium]
MKKALKIIGAIVAVAGVVAAAYFLIKKYFCKKDNCTCEETEDVCCLDDNDEICDCAECAEAADEAVEVEEDAPAEE